jgi:hypothetical protein
MKFAGSEEPRPHRILVLDGIPLAWPPRVGTALCGETASLRLGASALGRRLYPRCQPAKRRSERLEKSNQLLPLILRQLPESMGHAFRLSAVPLNRVL